MKKVLLFISMFLFITNVNALTFDVDLTNIEDKGNNGTIGSITNIDIPNKTIDAYFQDIGDEVNFDLTITNSGDRAGTLRSISVTSSNDKIEYTNNLPENGLAINGNDTNTVTITAKVLQGAVNGTSSSEIKITYNYDEGSCPEGEILSDDESMCLCPEGTERNEQGICITPEKPVECADDEIYNSEKKICEKKVVPTPTPRNPKTMDNIILITLLFIVSGLGIYAVMYKKLQTKQNKVVAGVITGVLTLGASFTVLVSMFGLDNLLSAIVNPITKSKELTVTVNETIDLIVTWDGDCDVTGALTPSNVFDGGSGTESDPYQIRTANQLACFAKSVNEGTTYEGKFIKQTKNIKLNDNLNDQAEAGDLSNANVWTSAGYMYYDYDISSNVMKTFSGIYNGDNHVISGLYILDGTNPASGFYKGMFGHTTNATFKNIVLSDVYMETNGNTGSLIGYALGSLNIDNITTYGKGKFSNSWNAGLVACYDGNGSNESSIVLENIENNINLGDTSATSGASGVIHRISSLPNSDEPNVIIRNVTNNGSLSFLGSIAGGIIGEISTSANVLIDNAVNTGNILQGNGSQYGGIIGSLSCTNATITNSHNSGNWSQANVQTSGGLVGNGSCVITFDNVYNSGNMIDERFVDYEGDGSSYTLGTRTDVGGIIGYNGKKTMVYNSFNTGDFIGSYAYTGGIVGRVQADEHSLVENCYNTGYIKGYGYNGGLVGLLTGDINKSYNKGNIHVFGGPRAGGLAGWGGNGQSNPVNIYNSYNEGDIVTSSQSGQHGGLCAADCGVIKNSYNRGNLIVKYYASDIGGITGQSGTISNVYNSGQIIFENDGPGYKPYAGGITSSPSTKVINSYNLGDITVHQNGYSPGYRISGISVFTSVENCVNTGNILVKYTRPVVPTYDVYIAGITFNGTATNTFNAGTITIDETELETPLTEDERNRIAIGQISFSQSGSGNKWNTDPNGHASGCLGNSNNCSLEGDQATGSYTTEEAPDILSIINGDDAFEIKEGDTLPTLKVFNE